jgi:hypothetical protein
LRTRKVVGPGGRVCGISMTYSLSEHPLVVGQVDLVLVRAPKEKRSECSFRYADLLERKGLYYAMWRQQVGERRTAPAAPRLAAVGE